MHENNIALLCDEAERLLELNIHLLQKMIDEPNVLTDTKHGEGSQLFDRSKALKRIEELQGEQLKISRKEMVLAVVGTMKAGKSTTINALVGKEILPNRNRPMTSLPTLIRHVPGKVIPDLQLNNIEPIHALLLALKKQIGTAKGKALVLELERDKDNHELLKIPSDTHWLKNTYCGESEIFACLGALNDLVRLASALQVDFPFDAYQEVHELPVIEVEFSHLTGMDDNHGTLTLLDTPGPNEARQPHLKEMMRDQLQKASAVLAVMDYTQLTSEADEAVRTELNNIAEVSAGRLFVLVNKFDQKDRNSDSAETVKQKVPAMLKEGMLTGERVYPGSSRYAYLANRALQELKHADSLSLTDEWVDDFVKETFGRGKKETLFQNKEMVVEGAQGLWKDSLLDTLITEVIQAAHAKAAALAVDSAAAKLVQNAENTHEYLSVRHEGLLSSIQSLQTQISGLLGDIENIASCQTKVNKVVTDAIKKIESESDALLKEAERELKSGLDTYFKHGKRQEKQALDAQHPQVLGGFFSSMFNSLTGTTRDNTRDQHPDFDPSSPEMKFEEQSKAIEFIEKIEKSVADLLNTTESKIKPTLSNIIQEIEKSFQSNAVGSVSQIASQINARLEDGGFSVKINFPNVNQLQANLAIQTRMANLLEQKSFSQTKRRRSDSLWGKTCGFFNTSDWGWEEYSVNVTRSVVNIKTIQKAVTQQTQQHFNELKESIATQINQPIEQEVTTFFTNFKHKVEQLRNTLIQSTEDHKNNKQEQEQLTCLLQTLNKLTPEMIRDSKVLKEELEPML